MRILMNGAAAVAFALGCVSVGAAAPCTMPGMSPATHAMPHCTAKTGPVVWFVATAKLYYLKGSPQYGKGNGTYVCRATAVARGGHPGRAMTGGSHGTTGGALPPARTMIPRPVPTTGGVMTTPPMPPGSMGSPVPTPMTSMNPASGNQGNTGAPGAGGQVPNNPASSSNSNPSPTPHP
jgi:hypothetical protein